DIVEVLVKEEREFSNEEQLVLSQDAGILVKEEIEVNEEPVVSHGDGVEMPIKCEIDVHEEPVLCQSGEMRVKEIIEFQKKQVMVHTLTHSEEKPHKCKQCGKVFSKKCSLKLHQMTHTGEKQFQSKPGD
ncbi:unnamed protein product, partial [Meganyctiphanes norvegica]